MSKKLKGKVALVTGGSRGIGAAIAKRLAQEGADVAISYSGSEDRAKAVVKELKKEGVKAAALKADQTYPAQVEELVNAVVEQFGRLDILVNNAGILASGNIDEESRDVDAFAKQLAVNIGGVVAATHAALKYIPEGGRIILIGSVNGERVSHPGLADYSATKAALRGYAKGWARDLGPKNITVNVVQPGPIDTDMNPDDTDFAEMLKPQIALGRYGKPEEVAAAVAFLASEDASYITGSAITVDGGFNA